MIDKHLFRIFTFCLGVFLYHADPDFREAVDKYVADPDFREAVDKYVAAEETSEGAKSVFKRIMRDS